MSCEGGKSSSPQSESSSGSTNQPLVMFQKEKDDLTLYGTQAPLRLNRTQTVRRAGRLISSAVDESGEVAKSAQTQHIDTPVPEKHRRSLDSTYRHSLESISEYKAKSSFSSMSLFASRDANSLDSMSSDCTDGRSSTDLAKEKSILSASTSYLSWIESVNSDYYVSAKSVADVVDVDTKVGEWNNFWLNYSSGSNKYATSPYLSISNDDKTGEDLSDCRSTTSTQREFTDKQMSNEQVFMSYDEVMEAIRCSQRMTEILQNALKRNENEVDESRNDSYYSQYSFPLGLPALFTSLLKDESAPKERPRSYSLFEPKEMQKQKQLLRTPSGQSSSGNCINTLLNSGVADMLKRVISSKKRDSTSTDDPSSRSSFTDWSSTK